MKLLKHKSIQDASLFTFANIFDKALPFLFLPLFTKYLDPNAFGQLTLFLAILPITNMLIGVSSESAVGIQYFKFSPNHYASYITTSLVFLLITFCTLQILASFFSETITQWTHLPPLWVHVGLLCSFGFSVFLVHQAHLRSQKKAAFYAVLQCMRTLLEVITACLFVIAFHKSWEGRAAAVIFANLSLGLIALFLILRKYATPQKKYLSHLWSFGAPLLPHNLAAWVLAYSDRYFINTYLGSFETGIYSLSFMFGMALSVLIQGVNQTWVPFVYESLSRGGIRSKLRIVQFSYLGFVGLISLALIFNFTIQIALPLLFPPSYSAASQYILWISLGYSFDGMYTMVCTSLFYSHKGYWMSLISPIVAVLKVALSFIIIPHWGGQGAAILTLLSFSLMFLLTWWTSSQIIKMPWRIGWLLLWRRRKLL